MLNSKRLPQFIASFARPSFHDKNTNKTAAKTGLVEGLVESQKEILRFMQDDPQISKREIAQRLGISTTAVDKNITQLKNKGLLMRVGPDKGGHWEVVKK